jgi:hypothetical protein
MSDEFKPFYRNQLSMEAHHKSNFNNLKNQVLIIAIKLTYFILRSEHPPKVYTFVSESIRRIHVGI